MSNKEKKEALEEIKDQKMEVTDDEAENAAGGAGFTRVERPVSSKTPFIKQG